MIGAEERSTHGHGIARSQYLLFLSHSITSPMDTVDRMADKASIDEYMGLHNNGFPLDTHHLDSSGVPHPFSSLAPAVGQTPR